MAETFTSFLLDLADSPSALAAFHADPRTAMTKAGLSEAEQSIVASRDAGRIASAIQTEIGGLDPVGPVAATWVVVLVSVSSSLVAAGHVRAGGDLVGRLRALATATGR